MPVMRHTITEKELNEWLCQPQWQILASSCGNDSNKQLEFDRTEYGCVFRVSNHGETIFLGANKSAAVAAYNDAP